MNPPFWTIRTVELGRRLADTSNFLYLTDPGVQLEIAYRAWVLDRGKELILVDTGPPLAEARERGLQNLVDIVDALASMGINAENIQTVILTHLHWDHAANVGSFPNAKFYAQQSEIDFYQSASRRHPVIDRFYSFKTNLTALIDAGRIIGLPKKCIFRSGIEALWVGGHTPGSQIVRILVEDGVSIIAGDSIPLFRNFEDKIPNGIHTDILESIQSIDFIKSHKANFIYAGHDSIIKKSI